MRRYTKLDQLKIAQTKNSNGLGCILRKGPINRAAIARWTDLSIPTVMSIVDDLFEKKAVRSLGKGEASMGKPPEMLELIPDRFFYIGVDLGRTAIRITVNNALLEQTASIQEPTEDPFPEEKFVARLGALVLQTVKQLKIEPEKILGAGIAMPGLIGRETGQVIFAPDFGWKDVPLQSWLEKSLPFPVLVKNSNHMLALNESYAAGEEDTAHVTFCVNLGYGIGAALVIGEEIYSGALGTSGELGHSVVDPGGPLCKCGNSGCLEAVASGEAIARQAQVHIAHHGRSKIGELCGGDLSKIDARMVFEAAALGDKPAMKIIAMAADYIGIGLSTAVNVLDPDRVVLCGGLMKNGLAFFDLIKAAMEEHVMPQAGRRLEMSIGAGGEFSTAKGASRMLMNTLWEQRALPI
ncbi:MAG: ROK family protein [Treponema sp.]|jgi:predicted NBD/HSP70 family sugar kinase|nr:ROK family protein [Treponema sp.]